MYLGKISSLTVSLLSASVFASTTTINTNPRISVGASGILSVSVSGIHITSTPIITILSSSGLSIDEKKLAQMTEKEKQKYIEGIINSQVKNSAYQGIQSVKISATASGMSNSGSIESLTLLPIKKDNKKNTLKRRVRKESRK